MKYAINFTSLGKVENCIVDSYHVINIDMMSSRVHFMYQ